jgi:PAS domain S-box-containing protein
MLRQRIAELEASEKPVQSSTYADFLFDNLGESILIIDPYTLKILDANPTAARRLGYQRSELCQMLLDAIEMPRPLDSDEAETTWQSSTSGTFFYEGQYRHKSGTLIPVEVSSRLVFGEDQTVMIHVVRDIRWRKEAEVALRQVNSSLEQQVRQRTAELAAEKEKLEAVLGSIVEGVAMMDAEKKIVYVNPAFVLLTNYTLAEAQSITFDRLFEYAAGDEQAQADAFANGESWSGEVKGTRQDGYIYPTILTIVPMLDEDGRLTGYVSSHQDISRFKALDKAQYSFITNVSHQLRTPLTNIKLYTQLLEDNFNNNGKAAHYLGVLNGQAKRLEHLVQDILELASLDSSETVFDFRPIHMIELFYQISDEYQARAVANQQKLRSSIHDAVPTLMGDFTRLRQALTELLDNALVYTPAGGSISLEIAVPIEEDRQWVTITVQDTGPGIPAEDQSRIFERFYRGKVAEQGDITGTGLGLCITQQIIQAHRGYVELQTESGVGTSFTIWLPTDIF